HRHRGGSHGRLRGHGLRAVAPGPHLEDPLRGSPRERAHHLHALHDPHRCAHFRGVRQHHHHAHRPQELGHALQSEPDHGGGGHLRGLRGAGHGHGGAVHDPPHHSRVLPGHRAPGLQSDLVRHHHRVRGRNRPHQPSRGHEHVRPQDPPPRGENGHRVRRRPPLHVGGRHPTGHPRGLPHHLSVAAEHDAVTERRALGWVAIGAVVGITWLALPSAPGLFPAPLMALTPEPVYTGLARRTRRPLIASLTVVVASALMIVGVVALFVSQFVTRGVELANTVREELRPGGALTAWVDTVTGWLARFGVSPENITERLRVGAGEIVSRTAGMAGSLASGTFIALLGLFFALLAIHAVLPPGPRTAPPP